MLTSIIHLFLTIMIQTSECIRGSTQRKSTGEWFWRLLGIFGGYFLEILPLQNSNEKRRKTQEKLRKMWENIFSIMLSYFSLCRPPNLIETSESGMMWLMSRCKSPGRVGMTFSVCDGLFREICSLFEADDLLLHYRPLARYIAKNNKK